MNALKLADPTSNSSEVALSLNSTTLSISEGSAALIGFALAKPRTEETQIQVNLQKVGGRAVTRFNPFPSTITIAAVQQIGSVTLTTINDSIYEGTQHFTLSFSSQHLDTSSALLSLTLLDDELKPSVTFALANQTINKSRSGRLISSLNSLDLPR